MGTGTSVNVRHPSRLSSKRGTGIVRPMGAGNRLPLLSDGMVHLWQVPLCLPDTLLAALEKSLQDEERADCRHLHDADKTRRVVSRGALRVLLSRYLDVHPRELSFGYGTYGKPFLASPRTSICLDFNVSQWADIVVIAAALSRSLGIDVERVRPVPELDSILSLHFQEGVGFLGSTEGDERILRFLRIWTRIEASAKAFGRPLTDNLLSREALSYEEGGGIRLEHSGEWHLQDLQLPPRHVGALCARGFPCRIVMHDFSEFLLL